MRTRCPVCGVIYLSGTPDSLNMQQRTWDMQTKCCNTDCYAKSRPPSLEIGNCDLNKTVSYSAYILPIMLYGWECSTATKADVQWIDALDRWCLRRILDVHWHEVVRNDAVRRATQPPLSSIVKSRRLSLSGHVTQVNESADASRILFAQPPDNWRRPPGRLRSTWIQNVCLNLSSFGMELPEARKAVQNQPFWRMLMKCNATQL